MPLTKTKTKEIADKFSAKPNDTGSISVQIALLTERIQYLSKHIAANPKDYSSARGLSTLVVQRKNSLAYLNRRNREEYKSLIKRLGLRK